MDRELWAEIRGAVTRADRAVPRVGRRRPTYPDRLVVLMLLWAAWQGKCLSWACDRLHYNTLFRPRALPSVSRFARRAKSGRASDLLRHAHDDLARRGTPPPVGLLDYLDGKALLVGPVSKDPDARRGWASGGWGKGYKLHAYVNEFRRIVVWAVAPLNVDEKAVAAELVACLPVGPAAHADAPAAVALAAPLTLADSNYDAGPLYAAFAARGRHLLAPLRGQNLVGPGGRSARHAAAMPPGRREAVAVWDGHRPLAEYLLGARVAIERVFSVLSLAGGLDRLPPFVRRLDRAVRWTGCKIILYHARLLAQEAALRKAQQC